MPARFDPARLFESPRPARASSDAAELDAIAAGTKPMSLFVAAEDEVADYLALAVARGLTVTVHPETALDQLHVFVARPEEHWRIPAYLALWETAFVDGRWSDASENLAGYLLGYTRRQRKAWLAAQHQAFPAWTSTTVYAIVEAAQRAAIDEVGRRCFASGLELFVAPGRVLRSTAVARVPRGHTLARAGIDPAVARRVFGAADRRALTRPLATLVNGGLRSNVQFLTRSGWR